MELAAVMSFGFAPKPTHTAVATSVHTTMSLVTDSIKPFKVVGGNDWGKAFRVVCDGSELELKVPRGGRRELMTWADLGVPLPPPGHTMHACVYFPSLFRSGKKVAVLVVPLFAAVLASATAALRTGRKGDPCSTILSVQLRETRHHPLLTSSAFVPSCHLQHRLSLQIEMPQ